MYQRILVPVDGSAFAEEVLPYALGLADAVGARLALMRVAEDDSERDDISRDLRALAQEVRPDAQTIVGRGNVVASILEEAAHAPGTLVAMTSRGRSGLAQAVLGSVARDIVRTGRNPVLVYHPRGARIDLASPASIGTVMLPIDGSTHSEWIEDQAAAWAKALGVRLMVVQVISEEAHGNEQVPISDALENSYVRSHATKLAEKHGIGADWDVLYGSPVEAMTSYIGKREDVLVVMATRARSGLRAAVLGSVTAGLLREAGVPIIVGVP